MDNCVRRNKDRETRLTLAVTSEALRKINADLSDVIAGVCALLAFINELEFAFAGGLAAASVMFLAFALIAAGSIHAHGVGVAFGGSFLAFVNLVALSLSISAVAIFAFTCVGPDLIPAEGVLVAIVRYRAFVDVWDGERNL